jgi:hypothetical protein
MSETHCPGSIVVGLDEHGQPASTLLAAESADQARQRAHDVLTGCIGRCPTGIQVSVAAIEDEPAAALLRLAAEATLLTPLNIYTLDPVHPPHPMPTAAP